MISPSIWCGGSLPSGEDEDEDKHQAIPAIRRGQSLSMGGKEEYINEDIERDNNGEIRKGNRIPMNM